MIPNSFRYVNRMLNIGYFTGIVRHSDDPQMFFLNQTANSALDIPFRLPSKDFKLPPKGAFRTVIAHVRGEVTQYGQSAYADVLAIQMPSVLNVNPFASFLVGHAKRVSGKQAEEGSPYNARGELKQEYLEQIKSVQDTDPMLKTLIDMYEQEIGRTRGRFDSHSNVIMMAGVVHKAIYIPPNEHQSHGFASVSLRQHKSLDECVPVRIVNNKISVILERLRPGAPISLKGRLRRKIVPTPDGSGVLSDTVWVETDMLGHADPSMILPPVPEWYADYVKQRNAAIKTDEREAESAEAA